MQPYSKWITAAACLLLAFSVRAEDAPATQKADAPKEELDVDQIEVNTGSRQDFEQVCKDAGIEGAELERINQLADKRTERLKAWAESADGKKYIEGRKQITLIRRERSAEVKKDKSSPKIAEYDAKIKEVRAVTQPLGEAYVELRTSTRGEILKTLTPVQQSKVINANLMRRVLKQIEAAKITDEQKAKIEPIIAESSADYLKKQTLDQDPYLRKLLPEQNAAVKKIRADILTPEQQESLTKKRTPTTRKEPTTQKE